MWELTIEQKRMVLGGDKEWESTERVVFQFEEMTDATDLAGIVLSANTDRKTKVKIERKA